LNGLILTIENTKPFIQESKKVKKKARRRSDSGRALPGPLDLKLTAEIQSPHLLPTSLKRRYAHLFLFLSSLSLSLSLSLLTRKKRGRICSEAYCSCKFRILTISLLLYPQISQLKIEWREIWRRFWGTIEGERRRNGIEAVGSGSDLIQGSISSQFVHGSDINPLDRSTVRIFFR